MNILVINVFSSPTLGLSFYLQVFLSLINITKSFRPLRGAYFLFALAPFHNPACLFPSPSRGLFFIQKKLTKRLSLVCFRPLRGAYFLSCPCKPACSKALHRILRRSPCHSPLTSVFFTAQPLPTQSASGAVHHFSFNDVRTAPIPSAVLIPMPQ